MQYCLPKGPASAILSPMPSPRISRPLAGLGLFAASSLGLLPLGCAGRASAWQTPSDSRPPVPEETVERLKTCVEKHGAELREGSSALSPLVRMDSEGNKFDVITDDMPRDADELAACTRLALWEMNVPAWMLAVRPGKLPTGAVQNPVQRSAMGSPVVVVLGVTIVLADLVIEAGAITLIFTLAIEILDDAAKDIAEAGRRRRWKEDCIDNYARCMSTPVANDPGNHWRHSRCAQCLVICKKDEKWPESVGAWEGSGSCDYRKPGWGPD